MKSLWRKHYSIVIPSAISIGYFLLHKKFGIDLSESINLADAMGGIITAISIVLSLFGVMLAIVIPVQTQDNSVKMFFEKVDKKALIASISNSLAAGFITLILSFALYFSDVLSQIAYWVTVIWLFSLLYLFCSAFRFITLFLSMLFTSVRSTKKKDNRNITAEEQNELDRKLLEQNEIEDNT